MTGRDLSQVIGKTGLLSTGKLSVPVRVLDSRFVFGRNDVLIAPIGGQGNEWVDVSRVSFNSQSEQGEN